MIFDSRGTVQNTIHNQAIMASEPRTTDAERWVALDPMPAPGGGGRQALGEELPGRVLAHPDPRRRRRYRPVYRVHPGSSRRMVQTPPASPSISNRHRGARFGRTPRYVRGRARRKRSRAGCSHLRQVRPGAATASRICCWCSQRSVYSRPTSNQLADPLLPPRRRAELGRRVWIERGEVAPPLAGRPAPTARSSVRGSPAGCRHPLGIEPIEVAHQVG